MDFNNFSLGLCLQWYLMASYLYYIHDKSLLEDSDYDTLAKKLHINWDNFDHRHKILISKLDLEAGTLYSLTEDKYPTIIKSAANAAWRKL